jgi:putative transcriptional regulator
MIYYHSEFIFLQTAKLRGWRKPMNISYDKLWKLMKNNKMKKSELAEAAGLSSYVMTKLNNDRPVSMEVMLRLCKIFHCDIGDVMEVIEDL